VFVTCRRFSIGAVAVAGAGPGDGRSEARSRLQRTAVDPCDGHVVSGSRDAGDLRQRECGAFSDADVVEADNLVEPRREGPNLNDQLSRSGRNIVRDVFELQTQASGIVRFRVAIIEVFVCGTWCGKVDQLHKVVRSIPVRVDPDIKVVATGRAGRLLEVEKR